METVVNQEPVCVIIHRHWGVVVTVLVALLNQLAVIMEHAQAKKLYFDNFSVYIPKENRLTVKTAKFSKSCNHSYVS